MLETVTIQPEPAQWPTGPVVRSGSLFGRELQQWTAETRSELFGSSPSFVVATGHQAQVWHPGILAKYLALDAFADAAGADLRVELVVDQDPGDPLRFDAPLFDSGEAGRLVRETLRLHDAAPELDQWSTGAREPLTAQTPDDSTIRRSSLDGVRDGCLAVVDAFNESKDEATLALQSARATVALRRRVGLDDEHAAPREILAASRLARTTLWHALLDRLAADPRRATNTYNDAVKSFPNAGVAPLEIHGDEIELPLWLLAPDRPRERFTSAHLEAFRDGTVRAEQIWPRGLLMTGFMRLAVVDLMIHGLGGEAYDRITEQWMQNWIGADLAPFVVVSATAYLDFDREPATAADLAQATWWAHHLPHNLDRYLDEPEARERKRQLLKAIETAPPGSRERSSHFQALTLLRRELASRRRSTVQDAVEIRQEVQRGFDERAILLTRTWPFPLYERRSLHELARVIRNRFTKSPSRP